MNHKRMNHKRKKKQQKYIEMVSMLQVSAASRTQKYDDKDNTKNRGNNIFNGTGNLHDNLISDFFSAQKKTIDTTLNQQFQFQTEEDEEGWVNVQQREEKRNGKKSSIIFFIFKLT